MNTRYSMLVLLAVALGLWSVASASRDAAPSFVRPPADSASGASDRRHHGGGDDEGYDAPSAYCSQTARAARSACDFEVEDDFWIASGICINLSSHAERRDCRADAREERRDGHELCADQHDARRDVCGLVGEERYAPDFDPASFVDPDDIGDTVDPNPYFPLVPGTRWVWEGGDETITDTVTDKTKEIEGVTCRVVLDVVEEDGEVIEVTDDWYAQDLEGNVWYCGEVAQNFETFDGDDPEEPELVDIDGSWKAGRDGSAPGITMPALPQLHEAFRGEMALGEAEDVVEVISITGTESVPAASCVNTCVVTRDFTALEPGVDEFKYYAPGVGLILELAADGTRVELVEFEQP